MNGYRAILYDIDGTLLNTRDMNLYPLLRIIQEELGETWTMEQVLKYTAYAGRQVMAELGIRDPETVYARWVRYVNEYPEPAALFPGLERVLPALHQAGWIQAIASSKRKAQFDIDMAGKGILPYFATVVLEEDTAAHKPDPAPLLLCLERLGLKPEEAIYIGDTASDCLAAKRARMAFGYAQWGGIPGQIIEKADYVFSRPEEMLVLKMA